MTTAAIYRYFPALANDVLPGAGPASACPTSNQTLCNSAARRAAARSKRCCPSRATPATAWLGIKLGGDGPLPTRRTQFGYNAVPPLDLPGVDPRPFFPPIGASSTNEDIPRGSRTRRSASRTCGRPRSRTPSSPRRSPTAARRWRRTSSRSSPTPRATSSERYRPCVWRHPLGARMHAELIDHADAGRRHLLGTADGVGFLPQDDVAAKTGTAQTGERRVNHNDRRLDDRLRAGDRPGDRRRGRGAEPGRLSTGARRSRARS